MSPSHFGFSQCPSIIPRLSAARAPFSPHPTASRPQNSPRKCCGILPPDLIQNDCAAGVQPAFLRNAAPGQTLGKTFLQYPSHLLGYCLANDSQVRYSSFQRNTVPLQNSVRGRAEWQADEHRLEQTERSFSCVRDRVLMGLRTARPAAMLGGLLFLRGTHPPAPSCGSTPSESC